MEARGTKPEVLCGAEIYSVNAKLLLMAGRLCQRPLCGKPFVNRVFVIGLSFGK